MKIFRSTEPIENERHIAVVFESDREWHHFEKILHISGASLCGELDRNILHLEEIKPSKPTTSLIQRIKISRERYNFINELYDLIYCAEHYKWDGKMNF